MDLRREFLRYAQLKDNESNVNFIKGNSLKLPFKENIFDCILLGEIIEHIAYPEILFAEIYPILKRDGLVIITTPNGNEIFSKLPTYEEIKDDRCKFIQKQFKPDADGHLFLFTSDDFVDLLGSNFRVVSNERFGLNYFFLNDITNLFTKLFSIDSLLKICTLVEEFPIINKYALMELLIIAEKR